MARRGKRIIAAIHKNTRTGGRNGKRVTRVVYKNGTNVLWYKGRKRPEVIKKRRR